ncbi:MAG: CBS domain-containing protein [Rhodobacteraceae bacterium]|nr:CBS domain-containing protein [Paracoccaceae bacterium]
MPLGRAEEKIESNEKKMLIGKVMSSPVISATHATTIRAAAQQMRDHHVGALPVFHENRTVGIVTDRDLVMRVIASPGFAPGMETTVGEIMSPDVITCFDDQQVTEAAALMGEQQVRRLLVVDRSGTPVGILSVGDIAEHVSEELAGQVLGEISEARAGDARG